jgi:hypothetical protein
VEKGGMDEAFVDVTKEAKLRVAHGACPASWHGHLHLGEVDAASKQQPCQTSCWHQMWCKLLRADRGRHSNRA